MKKRRLSERSHTHFQCSGRVLHSSSMSHHATSAHLEVALSVATGDCIDVWDLHSGTHLRSFSVPADHMCFVDEAHFVVAQSGAWPARSSPTHLLPRISRRFSCPTERYLTCAIVQTSRACKCGRGPPAHRAGSAPCPKKSRVSPSRATAFISLPAHRQVCYVPSFDPPHFLAPCRIFSLG